MAHDEELGEITGGQENFYEVMSRLITSGIEQTRVLPSCF
jgi:hypothetical protein